MAGMAGVGPGHDGHNFDTVKRLGYRWLAAESGQAYIYIMRSVYLFMAMCLPAIAGTISTSVFVHLGLTGPGCSQSDVSDPGAMVSSAGCSALGAAVSASQNGWSAAVSADRNSDWRQMASTSATVTYADTFIIMGDTGSGFLQFESRAVAAGNAWVNYSFAGLALGCNAWVNCGSYPTTTTIPVTFGVPLYIQWDLHAVGGCSGEGDCSSGTAFAGFRVAGITRADGSPSTGTLQTLDSIPEPSTILLMAIGAVTILTLRFRRFTGA
jgi:hypothetical protein